MTLGRVGIWVAGAVMAAPMVMAGQNPAAMPTIPSMPSNGANTADGTSRTVSQSTPGANQNSSAMQDSSMSGSVSSDTGLAKDKMFLRKAAEGGLAEVQFGQLAAQKGTSDEVKKLGQKMVDDHTTLSEQMKSFDDAYGIRTPEKMSKGDQAEYDKLSGMSGTDFDKEYLAYMLKEHREDMREFHRESAATSDPDLKQAVTDGSRLILQHLYAVNQLALANGVPGAFKPKQPAAVAAAAPPK